MEASAQNGHFPAFYDQVPSITLHDPLAEFLGAAEGGVMEYTYHDAVRLAGHSCPTVAGTWLMVVAGLRALYGDEMPVRGEIEVYMAEGPESGATGVMATVVQLLTGAAAETGFHGIGSRFSRHNLLRFGQPVQGVMGLRRMDTGKTVQVALDASMVPWPDEMRMVMPRAVSGQASEDELRQFGQMWQERVRKMLVDHADDPQMIRVGEWQVA